MMVMVVLVDMVSVVKGFDSDRTPHYEVLIQSLKANEPSPLDWELLLKVFKSFDSMPLKQISHLHFTKKATLGYLSTHSDDPPYKWQR